MIYSDKTLSQKLERTEARANVDFVEARAKMFPASGATWIEVAGTYAMFDTAESPLTQTFGLGLFEEATHDDLERIEAFFKERDAPVLHEVSPMADLSLLALLSERGYQLMDLSSVLYQSIERENTLDLVVNPRIKTKAIEAREEKLWAQISATGWATEMEGMLDFMLELGEISTRCKGSVPFLAEIENMPVAAGGLFIFEDVAILAGASTVPEGRKQGAQTALLDARLRFAAERGCKLAMMAALPGSQSQRNAEKNNFRIAYTRTKWQLKD